MMFRFHYEMSVEFNVSVEVKVLTLHNDEVSAVQVSVVQLQLIDALLPLLLLVKKLFSV